MEAPTTADHRAADRHHRFLLRKVHEGIFATQSAAVAAALEQMIQDEAEREVALAALAEEIRARIHTPRSEFVDQEQAFSTSRATIGAARGVTYRPRFHPLVERDLETVAQWIIDYAVAEVAHRKLMEIERTFTDLAHLPHKGSVRDDLAPGLRAIPAARKAVIAFAVDDTAGAIFIQAVTYGGADWVGRSRSRSR